MRSTSSRSRWYVSGRARLATGMACTALLAGCTSSAGAPTPAPTVPAATTSASATAPSNSAAAGKTPATARDDWPMYHGTPDHSGVSTTMPAAGSPQVLARLKLDGSVYASPVVVGGRTYVATENDSVYAFDAQYRQVWKHNYGTPSPATDRPCGDIDPLGITGTPIVVAGVLYVVVEHGGSVRHELIAVDTATGATTWRRSIDLPGADAQVMQQRGALAVTGGRVWVPFGALAGDCGKYQGRVVGVRLDGAGAAVAYNPSTRPQGGIWNPAGPTVDAAGHLFVVSANGSSFPGDAYDHTNSVDELSSSGTLVDSFAPSDWAQNNKDDVGLGSQGVALVGKTWAVLGGKSGPVYVLRQGALGGIGGQVSVQRICLSFGGAAVDGDIVYLPCTDGVRAVRVSSTGTLTVRWHADPAVAGSPIVGGGRVWALDQGAGVLHSLDPRTGSSVARTDVGTTSRFATPAVNGRDVVVPTLAGITVVRTS